MVEYVILFFVLYGFSAAFSLVLKSRFYHDVPVSFCILISIMYLMALMQLLSFSKIAIELISIFGVVAAVFYLYKDIDKYSFLIDRLVFMLAIFSLAYLASWGSDLFAWDEYSHWGAQVEFLRLNKELHTDSQLLLFPDYIPGLSIWRNLAGQYHLDNNSGPYFLNWIFVFSIFGGLIKYERCFLSIARVLITFLLWVFFFQSLVLTLFADAIQSVLILLAYVLLLESDSSERSSFVSLTVVCVGLILFKHVGILFSIFIGCFYILKLRVIDRIQSGELFLRSVIFFTTIFLTFISWTLYTRNYNLNRAVVATDQLLTSSDMFFSLVVKNVAGVLINKFPHALFNPPIPLVENLDGTYFLFVLLIGVVFLCVVSSFYSSSNKLAVYFSIFSIVSLVLYLFFLGVIRAGTPWGSDQYSFSRYMCVLAYPICAAILLMLFDVLSKKYIYIGLVVVYFLSRQVALPLTDIFPAKKRISASINADYEHKANELKGKIGVHNGNPTIWYINTSKNSFPYFIFRMKSMPLRFLNYSAGWGFYLNDNSTEGLLGSKDIMLFKSQMCSADYIYIDNIEKEFWIKYGGAFNVHVDEGVYRVRKNDVSICNAVLVQ